MEKEEAGKEVNKGIYKHTGLPASTAKIQDYTATNKTRWHTPELMEGAFHIASVPQLLKAKTCGGWISLAK